MWNNLPSLILNEILSYLTYKDRIKMKVCLNWKKEIELKDNKRDTLVFHIGNYPLNKKWCWMNNRSLIKIENSFEIESLGYLLSPFIKSKFNNLTKICLMHVYTTYGDNKFCNPSLYVNLFKRVKELEINGFEFDGNCKLSLNKLKILVLKKTNFNKLKLDCPSLEIFICWADIRKIDYIYPNVLKQLETYNGGLNFKSKTVFLNLETLLFVNQARFFKENLLKSMPNLKKLNFYSHAYRIDMPEIERQKRTYGLNNLLVLSAGHQKEVSINCGKGEGAFELIGSLLKDIFDNYDKSMEPIVLETAVKYFELFDTFKILPNNFFQRFSFISSLTIDSTINLTHLREFLKLLPQLDFVTIKLYEFIEKIEFLDQLYLTNPIIRSFGFEDDRSYCELDTSIYNFKNLTFLLNLKLFVHFRFQSRFLPVDLIRILFKNFQNLLAFNFTHLNVRFILVIIKMDGYHLIVQNESISGSGFFRLNSSTPISNHFRNVNQLVEFIKSSSVTRPYCI